MLPLLVFPLLLLVFSDINRIANQPEGLDSDLVLNSIYSNGVPQQVWDYDDYVTVNVVYNRTNTKRSTGLWIRTFGLKTGHLKTYCLLPISDHKWWRYDSITRLSYNKILVTISNNFENMRLVLVNIENCDYEQVFKDKLYTGSVINPSSSVINASFNVITFGKMTCGGDDFCRLHFDPSYQKNESLNFNFPEGNAFLKIQAINSIDANRFAVQLYDESLDQPKHRVRLYNLSGNASEFQELLPDFTHQIVYRDPVRWKYNWMMSDFLSYCYRLLVQDFNNLMFRVRCLSYNEDGNVLLNYTTNFISSVHMHKVKQIPEGLILTTKPFWCYGKCKTLQVDVIRKASNSSDDDVWVENKMNQFDLMCEWTYFEDLPFQAKIIDNNTIEINYMCLNKHDVSVHSIRTSLESFETTLTESAFDERDVYP